MAVAVALSCGPRGLAVAALLLLLLPSAARADDSPVQLAPAPAGYPRAASCVDAAGAPLALAVVEAPLGDLRRLVLLRRVAEANATANESWAATGAVVASAPSAPDVDLANGFLLQLAPSGAILCAYRHHDGSGAQRVFRIAVSRSNDFGATWAPLAVVTAGPVGVWEPFLMQLAGDAGDMVHVYYSAEITNGGEQDVVRQTSTDGGATWSADDVRLHTAGSRNGMPGVAQLADGSLLCVFEGFGSAGWNHFQVHSMRSFDNGATWSQPVVVHAPTSSAFNSGSPQVAVCPQTGKIVVVFMSDEPLPPAETRAAWPDGAHIGVVSARLNPANISTPLVFPASADVVPTPSTVYWPSLLLDALGTKGSIEFSLRVAFQGNDGAAYITRNTLCIDS